ncbi:MAG: alkaline phosphatase family protein, partial [Bacteroidota bacterium]|nr:alkaline phosphatase family protein [Bacteroidota bacterium]MDX5431061.1 alkaline phosphatase family protein [Bacteroidota bacterium]MDX5469815.1 alkaline phosphatase family protein [Bacteroidota bacterium]
LFLSSDHGAAEVPAMLKEEGFEVGRYYSDSINLILQKVMAKHYLSEIVMGVYNDQIYLNHEAIQKFNYDMKLMADHVRGALEDVQGIKRIWTWDEINASQDEYAIAIRKGYHPMRSGDLFIQFLPGWLEHWSQGTTHGSGYAYDTHVPIVLYGQGIQSGKSYRRVSITDIAPSLSVILKVAYPSACSGNPLSECLKPD